MSSVAAGSAGVVAVGQAAKGDAVAWWSRDGQSWTRTRLAGQGSADHVIAYEGGFLAGGATLQPGSDLFEATVWTSIDGLTWSEGVRLPGDNHVEALAADQRGLIAGAGSRLWTSPDGRDWTSTPGAQFTGSSEGSGQILSVVVADNHLVAFVTQIDPLGNVVLDVWRSPP
jgi:hypothetical protein